jgi:hypothetical protein
MAIRFFTVYKKMKIKLTDTQIPPLPQNGRGGIVD